MSLPPTDPFDAPAPGPAPLPPELAEADPGRLQRYLGRVSKVTTLLGVVVLAISVVALILGVIAWSKPPMLIVVILVALPGILGPLMVMRRVRALASAASQPRELVAQARDLASSYRNNTKLTSLGGEIRNLRSAKGTLGKVKASTNLLRLGSQVLGDAGPDPDRHPLLVPFMPDRLTGAWKWLTITLWGLLLSGLLLFFAFGAVIIDAVA